MKKLLSFVCMLTMVFALTACGAQEGAQTSAPSSEPSSSQTTTASESVNAELKMQENAEEIM